MIQSTESASSTAVRASNVRTRYIAEFDGLRGISSILVVLIHVGSAHYLSNPFLPFWACMELFFCISGFVITYNIITKYGGCACWSYYYNRILRIWPMYYIAYLFAAIVATHGTHLVYGSWIVDPAVNPFAAVKALFFVQFTEAYAHPYAPRLDYATIFGHSWSVAAEEQFYAVIPFVIAFILRSSIGFRLAVALLMLATSGILRGIGIDYDLLLCRLDGFVYGVALGCLYAGSQGEFSRQFTRRAGWVSLIALATGLVISGPYVWGLITTSTFWSDLPPIVNKTIFDPYFGYGMVAAGIVGSVLFCNRQALPLRFLRSRIPVGLGRISYSTYLLHAPIVWTLVPEFSETVGLPVGVQVVLSLVLTFLLSWLSFHFVEKWFMKWKINPKLKSKTMSDLVTAQ